MPKFTYPIIFIFNDGTGLYNGYIPDLAIFAEGETLEKVYAEAEEIMFQYFLLGSKYNLEVPEPSSLEEVTKKWTGYKVSLISATTK